MRMLIHEWCCSGGLDGPDAEAVFGSCAASVRESVATEGRLMFDALLADVAAEPAIDATALVDDARPRELPGNVRPRLVRPGDELTALVDEAARADLTLLVAPEGSGILARRVAAVRRKGGRVLAPGDAFVAIASDKQATIDALAAAGLPVPAGRALAEGAAWPENFFLPAVRKARDGAGCEGLIVVRRGEPLPPPFAMPSRLEAFADGMPVGVACACGPGGPWPLPPMRQSFTGGRVPRYAGGAPLRDPAMTERAVDLARRAVTAVARAGRHADGAADAGWVGVDMILGDHVDGRDDRVLEVNPRLTTSFVAHARVAGARLVRMLIDAASGTPPAGQREPPAFLVEPA